MRMDKGQDGDFPLMVAVKNGNHDTVHRLILAGADVDQQDEYGWTALSWAAGKGDLTTVRILLDSGADVFKTGRDQRTPYMIALAACRAEVAKLLRDAGEALHTDVKPTEPRRKFTRLYYLRDTRRFPRWSAGEKSRNEGGQQEGTRELSDDDMVYLHEDYTVTESMWHGEKVLYDRVTPEWIEFCIEVLGFRVPDDLELIPSTNPDVGRS